MRGADRDMLATFLDMSEVRPVGDSLRRVKMVSPHVAGNRKERRAQESNARRKKNKFARS